MSQPTQRLSGALDLKIDQWTTALTTAKKQYDAWKASITPINVPPINTGGTGSSGSGGTGGNSNVPKLRTDLAALRSEMALAIAQTKLYGTGQDALAQTLNKVRGEAIALGKTQGAAATDVANAMKLALDATNSLGQIGNVSGGVQVQFKSLSDEAKLLKAQLAAVTPATAPADFEALKKKAQDLAVALAALQPAAQGDAQALAALQQQVNQLNNALGNANNNLNNVNQGANQQATNTSKLTALYGKLAAAVAAVGLKELAEFSRDAASDFAKVTNATVIFGKTLEANSIPISKGEALVGQLAERFKTLPENIRSSVTDLVRAGADIDQIGTLLNGAGASALAYGRDAKSGFEAVAQAVVSGSSAMLNQIGISENLGPSTDRYARSIGKTSEELTKFERAQAAVNLVQEATVQENALVEESLTGLVGKQQEANNAAEKARLAFGKAIQPAVIETTKLYASLLQQIADFFVAGDTSQENRVTRVTQLIKEQNEVIAFNIEFKKKAALFPNPATFIINANADAQIGLAREAIGKLEKSLDQAGVAAVRAGERASAVPAKLAKAAVAPIEISKRSLEAIKRLQEQIENSEVKAIPDTEARKIAKVKEDFQDILRVITALRKSDPGLASQLDGLEKRARAVQATELASIRSEAAKARTVEANADAQIAEQAERQASTARIAAMKDGTAKIKAEYAERQLELKRALVKDLEEVKGNQAAINRLQDAYRIERAAIRSQEVQDLRVYADQSRQVVVDAERALETARVNAMKEGSAKIRAQFRLEQADLEQKLAEDLAKVAGNAQAEARVRASYAGQIAALRIKTENDVSALEARAATDRAAKQKSLNRDIIDQEIKLATDRANATGSKSEIEQARYTAQLVTLDRFLNDQRAKYKDNAQALERINKLSQQQRELAEREHQKNLKAITDAGKLERVTARTNTAITGVGDLDFAGIARVRAELERLRRDSAGNAEAVKVVDAAFAKLTDRAKTLKDQLKKVFEDIASNSGKLKAELATLNDDPIASEQRRFQSLLDENKSFYDAQRKLALDNKDALLQINLSEAQDQARIAELITESRRKRERGVRDEILSGERDLAIEQARLRGDDDQARNLQAEKDKGAARDRYAALLKLAGDSVELREALERNLAQAIKNIDLQTETDRAKIQEESLKRTQDYLKFLTSNAEEIAKARATLNNDPVAGIKADAAARKRGLIEQYAEQIAIRRKAGQDTVDLERQLTEQLLLIDQDSGKRRAQLLKQQVRERLEITRSIEDLRLATARAIASATADPFDDLKTQLASDLSALDRAQADALANEKLSASDRLDVLRLFARQRQAILDKAAQTEGETQQKLLDDEQKRNAELKKEEERAAKERADAAKKLVNDILEANRSLQAGALDVLKGVAELTSSPFDDLAVEITAQISAIDQALEDFLKRENLSDEQRTQAREIAANKRTLILVNAAQKQAQAEQQIIDAGLEELNFLRTTAGAVFSEAQAREFNLQVLRAEITLRNTNVASLERQVRVGVATTEQLRTAKRGAIQAELEYANSIKASISALKSQANSLGSLGGAIQQVSAALNQRVPAAAVQSQIAFAKQLAQNAQEAIKNGASLEEISQTAIASANAFQNAAQGIQGQAQSDFKYLADLSKLVQQGAYDPKIGAALADITKRISDAYNIDFDATFKALQRGLIAGSDQLDFSQLKIKGSENLQPIQDFLVDAAQKSPEALSKIRMTITDLEQELKRVQDGIIAALRLENVQEVIVTTVKGIQQQLEDSYRPFANTLGADIAAQLAEGFNEGFKNLTQLEIPALKVNLLPQLAALNPGDLARLGFAGSGVTNIYQIDGKTIGGAPLNVREALSTLKRFAEQETAAGTAVPGR